MSTTVFAGGVHPNDCKLTAPSAIERAPLPERVFIPVQQHIGAPCSPLVNKGDQVLVGQPIASSKSFVSAPIHASISGTVKSIGPYPHPMGRDVTAVEIESDGQDKWLNPPKEERQNLKKKSLELKKIIMESGCVGLGGATFPTHVKLSPPDEKPIDTLIINGVECEPYLTADDRLMMEKGKEIVEGIQILIKVLGVKEAFIGIEKNKPLAIKNLQNLTDGTQIGVIPLDVKYPQGSEKHLIKAILDREVPPPPGLPMDVGVVVQNVGTVFSIWEAVVMNKPLVERVVTVTGEGIKNPKNILVRLGTPISELIELSGGFIGEPGMVILGGPMMGMAQYTLDIPVIKGTSGVLVRKAECIIPADYRACIRCGKCIDACPMLLQPNLLGVYCEHNLYDESEKLDLLACMECGSCVYVCPAKRPMVQFFKHSKSEIMAAKKREAAKQDK
jgi:electron transport complex protein RnfC